MGFMIGHPSVILYYVLILFRKSPDGHTDRSTFLPNASSRSMYAPPMSVSLSLGRKIAMSISLSASAVPLA